MKKIFIIMALFITSMSINIVNSENISPSTVIPAEAGIFQSEDLDNDLNNNNWEEPTWFNTEDLKADLTLIPSTESTNEEHKKLAQNFKKGTLNFWDVQTYLKYIINNMVWFASFLAVIFVMVAGYKNLSKAVTDGDATSWKKSLWNVIIGLAFVVFSWMIIDLVIRLIFNK